MRKVAALVVLCVLLSYSFLAEAAPGVDSRAAGVVTDDCDCLINIDLSPVCGSDGITYPNEGSLDCENKCNRSNVTIAKYGPCR